jgi:hypothetical protein
VAPRCHPGQIYVRRSANFIIGRQIGLYTGRIAGQKVNLMSWNVIRCRDSHPNVMEWGDRCTDSHHNSMDWGIGVQTVDRMPWNAMGDRCTDSQPNAMECNGG